MRKIGVGSRGRRWLGPFLVFACLRSPSAPHSAAALPSRPQIVEMAWKCVSRVVSTVTHNYRLLCDTLAHIYRPLARCRAFQGATSEGDLAKVRPAAERALSLAALALRHFDFDGILHGGRPRSVPSQSSLLTLPPALSHRRSPLRLRRPPCIGMGKTREGSSKRLHPRMGIFTFLLCPDMPGFCAAGVRRSSNCSPLASASSLPPPPPSPVPLRLRFDSKRRPRQGPRAIFPSSARNAATLRGGAPGGREMADKAAVG